MTIEKAAWAVCLAFSMCLLVAIGPYLWAFGSWRIDTHTPELWAHFGTYLSGVLGPLLAVLNLLAIVYIAVQLTQLQQIDLASKRLSLDLFVEWHDREMHTSRIKVSKLLTEYRANNRQLPSLTDFEVEAKDVEAKDVEADIFRIYHFFEKWALLVQEKHVEPKLLQSLLGGYAAWWNEQYFSDIEKRETDEYMLPVLQTIKTHVFLHAKSRKTGNTTVVPAPELDV
jgi:hypothetical protein